MTANATNTRRRLLFLLPFAPRLDAAHGGSRVMAQLLTQLAARHHIAVLYLRAVGEPPIDERLREQCDHVEEVLRPEYMDSSGRVGLPLRRVLIDLVCGKPLWVAGWSVPMYAVRACALARAWRPDVVQIEFHIMAQYLHALSDCPAPRILVEHEPGVSAAWERLRTIQGSGHVMRFLDLLAWVRFERKICKGVQMVVVFTERDRRAIASLADRASIVRIPLGTLLPDQPLNPLGQSPPTLVFVGNFMHPPNVDAALRLANSIFPRVREHHHDATLLLVGDNPPLEVRQLASDAVIVTGYVPEVTPYLDGAALVVVPLRLGGGMRVKVLEALSAGKPVVATPRAIEGLDVIAGQQIAIAESDEQFIEAILQLLADPECRRTMAVSARAWACTHLQWDHAIVTYEVLYHCLSEPQLLWSQQIENISPM
jgi:glycosyltransferase involved in cell wall biosynthesis